jgi:ribonucleoside-diphosphate reductase beta chain
MKEQKQYAMFPLKHQEIFDMYQEQVSNFWTATEISMSDDLKDWKKLNDDEKFFIKNVLAFFAGSDELVNMNLSDNLMPKIGIKEAVSFYRFQMSMEDIHSHAYALQLDTLFSDEEEKNRAFNAISEYPAVKKKADWAMQWSEDSSLAEQLVAFILVEGLFFSGSFCSLFWLKKRNLMPGLCEYNSLIQRDESLHYKFGIHMYNNYLDEKLSDAKLKSMIIGACENEKEFITLSLPVKLIGMNSELMAKYIEYTADTILVDLGLDRHYNSEQPFSFMRGIALESKGNFFERKVVEYSKAKVGKIELNEDEF